MTKTYDEALRGASSLLTQAGIDPDGARYVLELRGNFTPSGLRLHGRDAMPETLAAQFDQDLARLLRHEPAQYIVGLAPFYGDLFAVTPAVLIPRFETEELVAWAASEQQEAATGLDLGTGSGAIGLTLAKQLKATMTLSDVSTAALEVAQHNAQRLDRSVRFVQSDLFASLGRYDFIVANLPYISPAEVGVMDQSTLAYEPHLALFAEDSGLALFARFAQDVAAHLNPGGAVYLEFGYHQKKALAALFGQALPEAQVTFRQDLAGWDRMVRLTGLDETSDKERDNGNTSV
ncbi:peptide chain release factor N(5)-glutamine methyltransferase [Lacticaseibacillus parakribbianus]|uniref:peptide chain release factor N(5)-glutamine methyltransferase n=1 Tax=Lacticaseibacillus parakribbianus TaxID=2970927 RepID=UPI0021CB5C86|nr:peptide chain release factor N(5)-glutamine methyltransferase [Lacticaseibacillus parakribbianus]